MSEEVGRVRHSRRADVYEFGNGKCLLSMYTYVSICDLPIRLTEALDQRKGSHAVARADEGFEARKDRG